MAEDSTASTRTEIYVSEQQQGRERADTSATAATHQHDRKLSISGWSAYSQTHLESGAAHAATDTPQQLSSPTGSSVPPPPPPGGNDLMTSSNNTEAVVPPSIQRSQAPPPPLDSTAPGNPHGTSAGVNSTTPKGDGPGSRLEKPILAVVAVHLDLATGPSSICSYPGTITGLGACSKYGEDLVHGVVLPQSLNRLEIDDVHFAAPATTEFIQENLNVFRLGHQMQMLGGADKVLAAGGGMTVVDDGAHNNTTNTNSASRRERFGNMLKSLTSISHHHPGGSAVQDALLQDPTFAGKTSFVFGVGAVAVHRDSGLDRNAATKGIIVLTTVPLKWNDWKHPLRTAAKALAASQIDPMTLCSDFYTALSCPAVDGETFLPNKQMSYLKALNMIPQLPFLTSSSSNRSGGTSPRPNVGGGGGGDIPENHHHPSHHAAPPPPPSPLLLDPEKIHFNLIRSLSEANGSLTHFTQKFQEKVLLIRRALLKKCSILIYAGRCKDATRLVCSVLCLAGTLPKPNVAALAATGHANAAAMLNSYFPVRLSNTALCTDSLGVLDLLGKSSNCWIAGTTNPFVMERWSHGDILIDFDTLSINVRTALKEKVEVSSNDDKAVYDGFLKASLKQGGGEAGLRQKLTELGGSDSLPSNFSFGALPADQPKSSGFFSRFSSSSTNNSSNNFTSTNSNGAATTAAVVNIPPLQQPALNQGDADRFPRGHSLASTSGGVPPKEQRYYTEEELLYYKRRRIGFYAVLFILMAVIALIVIL